MKRIGFVKSMWIVYIVCLISNAVIFVEIGKVFYSPIYALIDTFIIYLCVRHNFKEAE